jgi:hypothetical protein
MPQDKLEQALLARHADLGMPALPEKPDMFQPDPVIVGDGDFAKTILKVMRDFPGSKTRIPSVTRGPTAASMRATIENNIEPDAFEHTNLTGVTDLVKGSNKNAIGINPRLTGTDLISTMAHEIAHTSGAEEGAARLLEKLYMLRHKQAGKK